MKIFRFILMFNFLFIVIYAQDFDLPSSPNFDFVGSYKEDEMEKENKDFLDQTMPSAPNFDLPEPSQNEQIKKQLKKIQTFQQNKWLYQEHSRKFEMNQRIEARRNLTYKQLKKVRKKWRNKILIQWNSAFKYCGNSIDNTKNLRLPHQFKAIAEIHVPKSENEKINQKKELEWFYEKGFNTVLIVWRNENPSKMINFLRSFEQKWNIIFTHGPSEIDGIIYFDLDKYRKIVHEASRYIDVVLPSWRLSSSSHYDTEVEARKRIVIMAYNTPNNIPIFGELFRVKSENQYIKAIPKNGGISGAVVQNIGTLSDIETLRIKESKEIVSNVIPTIIGPKPYYNSYNQKDLSQKEIWKMKETCSNNYLRAGARGIIMFSGDGAGNRKNNKSSLTKTKWRRMYYEQED